MAQGLQHIPLRIPDKWDPAWFARFVREVLALADIRNAAGSGIDITGQSDSAATLTVNADIQNLLLQTFVVAQPSGFLEHERTLAGEEGVLQILDGGDDANITVAIVANGINLGKIKQFSGYGLVGNPNNSLADMQKIAPNDNGDALAVVGGVLGFTPTPVWAGDHTWLDNAAIRLGTGGDLNIEHSGTASFIENATGLLTIDSDGGVDIIANTVAVQMSTTWKVRTASTDRLEIDANGAWLIGGSAGTAGQVPVSGGTGVATAWGTVASSGAGGAGGAYSYVGEQAVAGAAATNITFSGLDISVDEVYYVQFALAGAAAGAATLNIFFNGDTTATNYERALISVTGDNSAFGGLSNGDPGYWSGFIIRCPVTGRVVFIHNGGRLNGTVALDYYGVVIWDTSANLTSFTVNSSVASQIAIGSRVRVWKLTRGVLAQQQVAQTSSLVITSNNVFQTTSLSVTLAAGVYHVNARIWCDAHATPDMEIQFQYTGTVTNLNGRRTAFRITTPTTSEDVTVSLADTVYNMNDTSRFYVEYEFLVEVSTGGTFAVYARQVTSSGTSVTFLKGSVLTVTRTAT